MIDAEAKLHPDNPAQHRAHLRALVNTRVEYLIRKARSRKSQKQLGWYWGCILPWLSEATGHTVDEMHAYCTHKFLNPPMLRTIVIADGQGEVVEEVDVPLHADRVHLLNTGQMADYCDDIRQWAAGRPLCLAIPDPDAAWKVTQARQKAAKAA